jgi:DNA polymerase-3 subunit chi
MLCALAERAFAADKTLFIQAGSPQDLDTLDDFLWTYGDISFVPHEKVTTGRAPEAPITLAWDLPAPPTADLIVNFAERAPDYFAACPRVVELVDHQPPERHAARQRYRAYQDAGYTLATRRINAYEDLAACIADGENGR